MDLKPSSNVRLSEPTSYNFGLLVIEGEVYAYGPFVMSTKAEIEQAYRDYQLGRFGTEDF